MGVAVTSVDFLLLLCAFGVKPLIGVVLGGVTLTGVVRIGVKVLGGVSHVGVILVLSGY